MLHMLKQLYCSKKLKECTKKNNALTIFIYPVCCANVLDGPKMTTSAKELFPFLSY